MGACILCGKSAGLFYSLHKNCFEQYNASDQIIANHLIDGLGKVESAQLASTITSEVAKCEFSAEAQQRTLNRSLEYFSKHYIENNKSASIDIPHWIEVLRELSPNETLFVNKHFIFQQQNLLAMQELHSQRLPESNCNSANFSISLRENEQLWWCFNNSSLEQVKPIKNKHQWSVIRQVVESLMPKKDKQSLELENFGDGKLLITNKRMCFDKDEEVVFTEYKDIYSCTPTSGGILLQSRELSAIPRRYYCEDGRLLYGFIRHAQNSLSAE